LLAASQFDLQTARERSARVTLPPAAEQLLAPAPAGAQPLALTPEAEQIARELPGFAQRVQDAVDQRLADGIATVTEALAGVGIDLPEPSAALPELERRQHVWLQYAAGPNWIDLDPTVPDAAPGDVHATASTTLDALPDELVHRVSIHLVAEKVSWGVPAREELLAFEAASSELVGVPIIFLHPQPEAMAAVGEGISGAISGYRNFMPIMMIGEEMISGTPVTFATGEGVFDSLESGTAVEGDTLAEWLEIEVRTPAGVRSIVREVFDRVGADQRAIGPVDPASVPPVELVAAGDPETSYLPLAGLWSISVVSGAVPGRYFDRDLEAELGFADLAAVPHAYHFAQSVFALRDTALPGHRFYADEPNLTAFVLRPTGVQADRQTATTGLDLLHRSFAAVPLADSASGTHPLLALGVLSHAIEHAMIESGGEAPLNLPIETVSGVSRIFEEARRQGVGTLVLNSSAAGAALPEVGEAARQRIREALTAGYVVIVPERPVNLNGVERTGWWQVDPATGVTVDQMDDGGGAVNVEMLFIWVKVSFCMMGIVLLGVALVYATTAVSLLLIPSREEGSAYEDDAAAAAAARSAATRRAAEKSMASAGGGGVVGYLCIPT
jgi:hypothetical protein